MRSNMLAKLIREGNTSTDKIICCEIGRLFDRLSDYLYLYDMDKGTVFYGVFCLVFLNGETRATRKSQAVCTSRPAPSTDT